MSVSPLQRRVQPRRRLCALLCAMLLPATSVWAQSAGAGSRPNANPGSSAAAAAASAGNSVVLQAREAYA
ncbi:hypothetical protein V8G55_24835, partial [Salmonella enterica subsp. enterica serovar Kentucky]